MIKEYQEKVSKEIEETHKKQMMGSKANAKQEALMKGQNTPFPEDARPNHYLARAYEDISQRPVFVKKIDVSNKGVGGVALHWRKNIVATAADDCMWKVWNMDTGENIMTGEGHKDWIAGIDFHPVGSHLVTGGGDKSLKIWDFVNSSIAHTFPNCFS